jgi:hypothetical protein
MSLTHEALNDLRSRVLAGQDVSVEEYALLIASLRERRSGDVAASAAKKAASSTSTSTKAPKTPVELPDLLKDL